MVWIFCVVGSLFLAARSDEGRRLEPGSAAVLVEAIAEMSPGIPRAPVTLEQTDRGLRLERAERVQRVGELTGEDDPVVADAVAGVDRNEILRRTGERLEAVHVVGHRDARVGRIACHLVHVPG